MAQTIKGDDGPRQRQVRPGQRQQERLMRLARRRRRRQIWTSIILSIVIVTFGIVGYIELQRYQAQQAANIAAHATATAVTKATHATATAVVIANATATVVSQDCFTVPAGSKVDNTYFITPTPSAGPDPSPRITGTIVKKSDGLQYVDIVVGTGAVVKATGSTVSVQYTGWLAATCKKFSSSYDPQGQPFSVTTGQNQVIKGFEEGLTGMKVGGTRRVYIPPDLAYGAQAQGSIPANSTLIFDITILSVK